MSLGLMTKANQVQRGKLETFRAVAVLCLKWQAGRGTLPPWLQTSPVYSDTPQPLTHLPQNSILFLSHRWILNKYIISCQWTLVAVHQICLFKSHICCNTVKKYKWKINAKDAIIESCFDNNSLNFFFAPNSSFHDGGQQHIKSLLCVCHFQRCDHRCGCLVPLPPPVPHCTTVQRRGSVGVFAPSLHLHFHCVS